MECPASYSFKRVPEVALTLLYEAAKEQADEVAKEAADEAYDEACNEALRRGALYDEEVLSDDCQTWPWSLPVPEIGSRKVDGVTRMTIARLHLKLKSTHLITRTKCSLWVGSMYSFAASKHIVPEGFNPTRGITRSTTRRRSACPASPSRDLLSGKAL